MALPLEVWAQPQGHLPGASALGWGLSHELLGSQPLLVLHPTPCRISPAAGSPFQWALRHGTKWLPSPQGQPAGADKVGGPRQPGGRGGSESSVLCVLLFLLTQGVPSNQKTSHIHTQKLIKGEGRLALRGGVTSDPNAGYFSACIFLLKFSSDHIRIYTIRNKLSSPLSEPRQQSRLVTGHPGPRFPAPSGSHTHQGECHTQVDFTSCDGSSLLGR